MRRLHRRLGEGRGARRRARRPAAVGLPHGLGQRSDHVHPRRELRDLRPEGRQFPRPRHVLRRRDDDAHLRRGDGVERMDRHGVRQRAERRGPAPRSLVARHGRQHRAEQAAVGEHGRAARRSGSAGTRRPMGTSDCLPPASFGRALHRRGRRHDTGAAGEGQLPAHGPGARHRLLLQRVRQGERPATRPGAP